MVGLMMTFLSSGRGGGPSNGPGKVIIGQIGGTDVYSSELIQSQQEWRCLNEYVGKLTDTGFHSIVPALLPPETAEQIHEHPELFMLLCHEARNSGVRINPDDLQTLKTNYYQRPTGDDAETIDEIIHDGLTDLLLIQANFGRIASDVKISQPQRDRILAEEIQKIVLNVVELPASDFLAKAPAPTTQQAQAQFDKYAALDSGQPTASNPMGFGYHLQEGVKLQYFKIGRDEAQKTIEAQKSAYDWEVAARLFYLQHPDQFPATQPSAQAAASPPAVKPYEQVRDQALHGVRDPLVDKLLLDVQSKILTTLNSDWHTFTQNGGKGDYPSYAYLANLAESVQSRFGMKIYATELNRDYLSANDLSQLPAIGESSNGQTQFADYAMQLANQYLNPPDADTHPTRASLMQPAAPLRDSLGNSYIFRLTDVRPAEPPANLAEVKDKIDADLRLAAAYQLAQAAADSLRSAAHEKGLANAAKTAGRAVAQTDPFSLRSPDLGVAISLSTQGQADFIERSFKLLAGYNPTTNPDPIDVIEVPVDAKVFVAELAKVEAQWDSDSFFAISSILAQQMKTRVVQQLEQQWLDYDTVVARLGYKAQTSKS